MTSVLPVQRRRVSRMFVPEVTNYILSSSVGILYMAGLVTDPDVATSAGLKTSRWSGDVRRTRDIQDFTWGEQGEPRLGRISSRVRAR